MRKQGRLAELGFGGQHGQRMTERHFVFLATHERIEEVDGDFVAEGIADDDHLLCLGNDFFLEEVLLAVDGEAVEVGLGFGEAMEPVGVELVGELGIVFIEDALAFVHGFLDWCIIVGCLPLFEGLTIGLVDEIEGLHIEVDVIIRRVEDERGEVALDVVVVGHVDAEADDGLDVVVIFLLQL